MISLLKTSTLLITRDEGGGFWDDKGRWVETSTPTQFSIDCNIQPFKAGEAQDILPEGISTNRAVVVRTKIPLNTSEQVGLKTKADTTVIDSFLYEAFFSENWSRYRLKTDHYKVVFIRKDQDSEGSL